MAKAPGVSSTGHIFTLVETRANVLSKIVKKSLILIIITINKIIFT